MSEVIHVDVEGAVRRLAEALAGPGPNNLIDGRWQPPTGADTEAQLDPSRGARIGTLTYSSDRDVDEAIRAATTMQPAWEASSVADRLAPLVTLGEAVAAARKALVPLIAIEVGKTLAEADEEIDLSCALIELLADTGRWEAPGRAPLGVVAGISLYHYPVLSALWMALPALTAGNGYVLRPCTWSPATGVAAAELVSAAGYPGGLFNVVHGSLDVVNTILRHPGVAAVSYVGSGPWAQYMVDTGSAHGKRVHAHGAVRQVHVVAADADPGAAAKDVCRSATGYAGQRWLAGCTVTVDDPIAPTFVDALCAEAGEVHVGTSTDPATAMGPVIHRSRQHELVDLVRDVTESVHVRVDGSVYADDDGYFFGPTVIDRVPLDHMLLAEQVPGPVIIVVRDDLSSPSNILHRDAHATVRTIHGQQDHEIEPPGRPGWFGSLPWNWGHTIEFLTSHDRKVRKTHRLD